MNIHQETADRLGVSYQQGKAWNFARVYGTGKKRLARLTKQERS